MDVPPDLNINQFTMNAELRYELKKERKKQMEYELLHTNKRKQHTYTNCAVRKSDIHKLISKTIDYACGWLCDE